MNYIIPYDIEEIVRAMENTIEADVEDHSKIHVTTAELTYTERRIFDVLADGEPHSIEEILLDAMGKKFASVSLVPTYIFKIRKKLAGQYRIVGVGRFYTLEPVGVAP